MPTTIDCYFWNPELELENKLDFIYEDIGHGIELKKPVLTNNILNTIIKDLKQKRKEHLLNMGIANIIDTIDKVTDQWMDPDYSRRKFALDVLPKITLKLLKKDNIPINGKLQHKKFTEFKEHGDGLVKAYGVAKVTYSNYEPEIIGHICAGNILGIAAVEMVIDKLIDAATWVKVPKEEPVFGALYAKSIEDIDPHLAYTIAVLPYESKDTKVQDFLFSKSNIIRATGGEQARKSLTELAEKHKIPIAGHWHKFSFITIARDYLDKRAREIAELVSLDVTAWDQQGCFSPQEIFVETGGKVSPYEFTKLLAEEMETTSIALPKGINSGKMMVLDGYHQYLKKEIMGEPVKLFPSSTHQWLVIYDGNKPTFEPSPLFRVIKVKPVNDIMEIVPIIKPLGQFLQTVGVAIPNNRLITFANTIGEIGVSNIRTISNMTLQKSWEPWDGRFPLHELFEHDNIRWVSINTTNIDKDIKTSLERKRIIVNNKN
jgi:hypothetical protein